MKEEFHLLDSSVQVVTENQDWWRDLWKTIIQDDHGNDSLDLVDINGNTALILAAINDENNIVADLLIYGANPFHKNKSGQTALELVLAQRAEFEYLIERYHSDTHKERKMMIEDGVDPAEIFIGGLANSSSKRQLTTNTYLDVIKTLQRFEELYYNIWK